MLWFCSFRRNNKRASCWVVAFIFGLLMYPFFPRLPDTSTDVSDCIWHQRSLERVVLAKYPTCYSLFRRLAGEIEERRDHVRHARKCRLCISLAALVMNVNATMSWWPETEEEAKAKLMKECLSTLRDKRFPRSIPPLRDDFTDGCFMRQISVLEVSSGE